MKRPPLTDAQKLDRDIMTVCHILTKIEGCDITTRRQDNALRRVLAAAGAQVEVLKRLEVWK